MIRGRRPPHTHTRRRAITSATLHRHPRRPLQREDAAQYLHRGGGGARHRCTRVGTRGERESESRGSCIAGRQMHARSKEQEEKEEFLGEDGWGQPGYVCVCVCVCVCSVGGVEAASAPTSAQAALGICVPAGCVSAGPWPKRGCEAGQGGSKAHVGVSRRCEQARQHAHAGGVGGMPATPPPHTLLENRTRSKGAAPSFTASALHHMQPSPRPHCAAPARSAAQRSLQPPALTQQP